MSYYNPYTNLWEDNSFLSAKSEYDAPNTAVRRDIHFSPPPNTGTRKSIWTLPDGTVISPSERDDYRRNQQRATGMIPGPMAPTHSEGKIKLTDFIELPPVQVNVKPTKDWTKLILIGGGVTILLIGAYVVLNK